MDKQNEVPTLSVREVVDNDDGSSTCTVALSEEFIEWFKKKEGLKRWSDKRFQKFFAHMLEEAGE